MSSVTMKRTTVESVNLELGSFVSLAADPTAMPTMQGLSARKSPSLVSTLAVAAAALVAVFTR